jgi:hypothetical protein
MRLPILPPDARAITEQIIGQTIADDQWQRIMDETIRKMPDELLMLPDDQWNELMRRMHVAWYVSADQVCKSILGLD